MSLIDFLSNLFGGASQDVVDSYFILSDLDDDQSIAHNPHERALHAENDAACGDAEGGITGPNGAWPGYH